MPRFHVLTDRPRDGRVPFHPRWKASVGRTVSAPSQPHCQLQDPGLQLEVAQTVSWSQKKTSTNLARLNLAAFAVYAFLFFMETEF